MNYCKKFPSVAQARDAARGELIDIAELKLWQAVQDGQPWAISFCLRTIGRSRGYGEVVDVHLQVERVAAQIAAEVGLTSAEVLAEAQRLLEEHDSHDVS